MREIDLNELKSIELEILKDVAAFCEKHNLRYFLCGGTLLGAIRHEGFIPWDDDIDIMMPRDDYDKFVELYNINKNKEYYEAYSLRNNKEYWRTHCQVFDKRTILEAVDALEEKYKDNSIFIDVFPIDGMPNSKFMQNIYWAGYKVLHSIHCGNILAYKPSNHFGKNPIKNLVRTWIKYIFISLFRRFPTKKIIKMCDNYARQYRYQDCEYVALVAEYGDFGTRGIVPKSIYNNTSIVRFEGLDFKGPGDWDKYLSCVFGDYMQLPPESERVCKHWFKAYWK